MKIQDEIAKLLEQAEKKRVIPIECSKLADKALILAYTISDEKQKAEVLLEIGLMFYKISKFSKSTTIITEALQIFERFQMKEKIILCFSYIGLGLKKAQKIIQAKEYFNLILNATSKEEISDQYFVAKYCIGDINSKLGNFNKALEELFAALDFFSKGKNQLYLVLTLNSISVSYKNFEQPDKALEFGFKALEACKTLSGRDRLLCMILNNMGNLYAKVQNYDLAIEYHKKSLILKEKNKIIDLIPGSLNNLGDVYELLGKFDLAFNCYKRAYDISKTYDNDEVLAAVTFNLGKSYLHQANQKRAYTLFNNSIELANNAKNVETQIHVYNDLKDIYSENGDYERALEYQEKLFLLKERKYSIKLKEKNFTINNLINNEVINKNLSSNFEIIGNSEAIAELTNILDLISTHNVNVLITGATGTGKELFARKIHQKYKEQSPFVAINCAAIPDHLLESELFGYKKGAFTGASINKKGRIEQANGGTLFLDEIGDLSFHLQSKILRVIQDRVIIPIGGTKPQPVEIRIISATNRDIKEMVNIGSFRKDLYYRLNIMKIHIPPLKDRKFDIPILTDHFIKEFNLKFDKTVRGISLEALNILTRYSWPGNVRELKNAIEKAIILCDTDMLNKDFFSEMTNEKDILNVEGNPNKWSEFQTKKNELIINLENEYVMKLMELSGNNIKKASRLGNLGRTQIYRLLEKWER